MNRSESCFAYALETSSALGSVALVADDEVVVETSFSRGLRHGTDLVPTLDALVAEARFDRSRANLVVVGIGPGSYTGLRIGTSLAKGICYGKDIPLIAVSTLRAMADGLHNEQAFTPNTLLIPMLDARRMEVYTAVYDAEGKTVMSVQPMILDGNSFEIQADKQLICFGSGSEKAKPLFAANKNVRFIDHFRLSAKYLLPQAIERYNRHQFEDLPHPIRLRLPDAYAV